MEDNLKTLVIKAAEQDTPFTITDKNALKFLTSEVEVGDIVSLLDRRLGKQCCI